MSISIALSFPSGRFHATAWGRHVNEAAPDWPPAPWRLLRALVAVWKRTLASDPLVNQYLPSALAKLTDPPLYKLPPATLAHTRHYLTQKVKGDAKNVVFDGFVAVSPAAEVGVRWPKAQLSPNEQEALERVLARLNYLGRAEAWCAARLCDWDALPGEPCAWVDADTGKVQLLAPPNPCDCFVSIRKTGIPGVTGARPAGPTRRGTCWPRPLTCTTNVGQIRPARAG